jgi:hypothetical protein
MPTEIPVKDASGANVQWPIDEDFHTVRFVRAEAVDKDGAKGAFEMYLDDQKIVLDASQAKPVSVIEIGGLAATQGRQYQFGFLVDADGGAKVEVSVDAVKVTKSRPNR